MSMQARRKNIAKVWRLMIPTGTKKHSKTAVERHRRWAVALMWVALLAVIILTKQRKDKHHLYELSELFGYLLIIVATTGRLWCGIYGVGRESKELCQDGPYSLCRNPLYLSNFIGGMGVILAATQPFLLLPFILIFWICYGYVIKCEEKRLFELFGREYEHYCARVCRVIPRFADYRSPETIQVRPGHLARRVVRSMWFVWLIIALESIETLKAVFH